jgi:eukaryotic-like serine/threonine-protein kinase
MLSAGEVVGGFVIRGPLGRGGMGAVYRAWDSSARREVALKLCDVGSDSEGLLRFKREAEIAARVDAQGGVVRVHARGVHEGTPFLVLELIEGRDLDQELRAGPIAPSRLARIVEEVARALEHCHALGVVHRDIKPANVLLRAPDDVPLLTDFGIARDLSADKLTKTGASMGTPNYMAPEQAVDSSRATDPRVDIYALGAILYHGLVGRPPENVLARIARELPPPSSFGVVDPSLEAICLRAAALEPARRHPNAAALADDLARWRGAASGRSSRVVVDACAAPPWRRSRSRRSRARSPTRQGEPRSRARRASRTRSCPRSCANPRPWPRGPATRRSSTSARASWSRGARS